MRWTRRRRTWPGKPIDRYSTDYREMQTADQVKFYKTPRSDLKRQLEVYDEVVKKKSAENPVFKEVLQSQIAFAERGDTLGAGYRRHRRHGLRPLFRGETGSPVALTSSRSSTSPARGR